MNYIATSNVRSPNLTCRLNEITELKYHIKTQNQCYNYSSIEMVVWSKFIAQNVDKSIVLFVCITTSLKALRSVAGKELYRLWAGNSPPLPQGEFLALLFSDSPMSPEHFYLFCNLAIGAFGSYRGQRSSGALLHIVYYLTTKYVAFSCHFLNLVGQIIFLMV